MLTIENSIPLKWSPIDLPVDHQKLLEIQDNNKQLLLVLLDKHKNSKDFENEAEDTTSELKMLQHKVDLLTTWLGKLLLSEMTLPSCKQVKISSNGITVTTESQLPIEDTLLIECYIDPDFPQALLLHEQITSIKEVESGNEIAIQFIKLGTEVSDLLDKLIFQNHRRLIAYKKSTEL